MQLINKVHMQLIISLRNKIQNKLIQNNPRNHFQILLNIIKFLNRKIKNKVKKLESEKNQKNIIRVQFKQIFPLKCKNQKSKKRNKEKIKNNSKKFTINHLNKEAHNW